MESMEDEHGIHDNGQRREISDQLKPGRFLDGPYPNRSAGLQRKKKKGWAGWNV